MGGHFAHPTALIDKDVSIGRGTKIWAFAHVCSGATIGKNCMIGEGVYIGPGVRVGDNCKIQNHSLIYEGVALESDVFLGPNTVTTNDLYPRVHGDWELKRTLFGKGSSVGANCTILCGIFVAEHTMVGCGSVLTKSTEPHGLYVGSPARFVRHIDK